MMSIAEDSLNDQAIPDSLDDYLEILQVYGHTDTPYLKNHFLRLRGTVTQFMRHWHQDIDAHVLDIGAHWLHQAYLLSRCGFKVTAADFGTTLELESVRELADDNAINLITYSEIDTGSALDVLDESSVDVVFFTEILEHITFNPVNLWSSVYRVLKPGGRIVVTTPNFYRWGGRAWMWKRFIAGYGSGIQNSEILHLPTYGHHWKEFSRKEVCQYFTSLSPDFVVYRALEVRSDFCEPRTKLGKLISFILPHLYVEIDLVNKKSGIAINPSWD